MTTTLITAKNGQARPVNPFDEYQTNAVGDNTWKRTQEWSDFESTVEWHDCPECEDGEFEAELVWQWQSIYGAWGDFEEGYNAHDYTVNKFDTREVWRIVPQPQESPLDLMDKFMNSGDENIKSIMEEFNNVEGEGPTVKEYFDNFGGQKEEAKTVEGKTPEEVFNDWVNIRTVGNEVAANIIEAMQAYSSQQNTALMEENERLKKVIQEIISSLESDVKSYKKYGDRIEFRTTENILSKIKSLI